MFYTYTNDKRAIDTYREAWQQQAELESAQSADALFASVAMVRLRLPPNAGSHDEWVATVHYEVGADGKAAVADIGGSAPESLTTAIRKSYADAGFRPRLVGGEPIATTGLNSAHKYVATRYAEAICRG